jgi:hypothetical protein
MHYAYHFEQFLKMNLAVEHVFKIDISLTYSEVYQHSFGEICRWDGSRWQNVATLGADELSVLFNFDFDAPRKREDLNILFESDRMKLLQIALEVCTDYTIDQLLD